ncbi:hypothetical protein H8356DRAFT_1423066 [Neocallimastix lanati (nom. inval.)]|nr:hypothetical protein H8356DRAFT_1423066 [Neocallimastix sp. JGI-2020a]
MLILINYLKRSSLISNNFWNIQKPELDPLHIVIPEKKNYFTFLVHDSYEIRIPTPIDGVFIVDEIEKNVIGKKNFKSFEMFMDYNNDYSCFDFYDTFSRKDRHKKITKIKDTLFSDVRICYSLFFQLLRVKRIKSYDKQSISLV